MVSWFSHYVRRRIENKKKLYLQGFFREKPIESDCWASNILTYKPTTFNQNRWTLDIEFERNRLIGLGTTIGDGQSDRQTDTHTRAQTFFLKHIFDCRSDVEMKTIKKSKSNFLSKVKSIRRQGKQGRKAEGIIKKEKGVKEEKEECY